MKHPFKQTMILVMWLALCAAVSIFAIPFAAEDAKAMPAVSQPFLLTLIVCAIIIGALFWMLAIRWGNERFIRAMLAIGLAAIGLRVFGTYFPLEGLTRMIASAIVAVTIGLSMHTISTVLSSPNIRKSGTISLRLKVIGRLATLNNAFYSIVIPTIGAIYGLMLSPTTAFVIFLLVALYDAWAVWKSKIMVKMADYLLNTIGAFPGLLIVYQDPVNKDDIRMGFLGGGDIFFLALMTAATAQIGVWLAMLTLVGMSLALIGLFFAGDKKPYPAIPFMVVGYVIAFLLGSLA